MTWMLMLLKWVLLMVLGPYNSRRAYMVLALDPPLQMGLRLAHSLALLGADLQLLGTIDP